MKASSLIVVGLLVAGCGHARVPDKLFEADQARLDPASVSQLEAARQELAQAKDEVARASEQVGDARHERTLGDDEWKAAEARSRAADARRDYGKRLVEAREAAEEAGKRRADAADAKLELARFQALERVDPAAVSKLDQGAFYERVAASQRDLDQARERVRRAEAEAKEQQRRWEELARKVQNQP